MLLHLTTGIFPANAGVFLIGAVEFFCGLEYSPRTRGSSRSCGKAAGIFCIFPANAGVILMQCVFKGSEEYIPRERGGHPLFERLTFKVTGYSPRTRGSTLLDRRRCSARSIFPANAGVNLRWHVRVQVCEHSPA